MRTTGGGLAMERSQRSAAKVVLPVQSMEEYSESTPLSVLIVEPRIDALLPMVKTLSAAGFEVTATPSYEEAKPLVGSRPPAVLVTAVRLGTYNGLHLVLRGKAIRGDMAAIVTASHPDPVLEADAQAMGATFVVGPIQDQELVAAVLKSYFCSPGVPLQPPFERRRGDRRGQQTDVSVERRQGERRRHFPWLRI